MGKSSREVELKKRELVQNHFWNEVGAVEHISLPRLKDALKKEFKNQDDRFVEEQVMLMQTEARIRIESHVKVWIKQPAQKRVQSSSG
jgi:hypothetical protein